MMISQGIRFKRKDHITDVPLWFTGLMAFYRFPQLLALLWKACTGDIVDPISICSAVFQIAISTAVFFGTFMSTF